MVRPVVHALATDDQGLSRSRAQTGPAAMSDKDTWTTPLVASVCYVRHAVSEPQACARFVSDIFGLQQVADQNGELAFRSDDRYRSVSLSSDQDDGASVGIE